MSYQSQRRRLLALAAALAWPLAARAQEKGDKRWCHMKTRVGVWEITTDPDGVTLTTGFTWKGPMAQGYPASEGKLWLTAEHGKTPGDGLIGLQVALRNPPGLHFRIAVDGQVIFDGRPVKPPTDVRGVPRLVAGDRHSLMWLDPIGGKLVPLLRSGRQVVELQVGPAAPEPWLNASFSVAGFADATRKATELSNAIIAMRPIKGECEDDCFLTTAVCGAVGLGDECFELRTLRAFRDGPLRRLAGGPEAIEAYYAEGPALVAALRERLSRAEWCRLYAFRILPCVALARLGLARATFALYRRMVTELRARIA